MCYTLKHSDQTEYLNVCYACEQHVARAIFGCVYFVQPSLELRWLTKQRTRAHPHPRSLSHKTQYIFSVYVLIQCRYIPVYYFNLVIYSLLPIFLFCFFFVSFSVFSSHVLLLLLLKINFVAVLNVWHLCDHGKRGRALPETSKYAQICVQCMF